MADLQEFSGQISLKIDRFWDNLTRFFYIILKEIIICSLYNYISSRNEPMAKQMASVQFFAT